MSKMEKYKHLAIPNYTVPPMPTNPSPTVGPFGTSFVPPIGVPYSPFTPMSGVPLNLGSPFVPGGGGGPIGGMPMAPGFGATGAIGMGNPYSALSPLGNTALPNAPSFTALDMDTGLPQDVKLNYPYPYPYMHPYAFLKKRDYPYTLSMDVVD
jgi:hypothetical protein